MTQPEKISALEELFEVQPGSISPEGKLADMNWDSMTQLGLIALLRSEFNHKLDAAALRKFTTVADILAVMQE